MAENRTPTSIAAQMVIDRIPLPAYGYRINPALPLAIPRPVVPWVVNVEKRGKKRQEGYGLG